ncbi:hypothetical protein HGB13_00220 [bacterium]|nr:hypothetical protein [bacterium]
MAKQKKIKEERSIYCGKPIKMKKEEIVKIINTNWELSEHKGRMLKIVNCCIKNNVIFNLGTQTLIGGLRNRGYTYNDIHLVILNNYINRGRSFSLGWLSVLGEIVEEKVEKADILETVLSKIGIENVIKYVADHKCMMADMMTDMKEIEESEKEILALKDKIRDLESRLNNSNDNVSRLLAIKLESDLEEEDELKKKINAYQWFNKL